MHAGVYFNVIIRKEQYILMRELHERYTGETIRPWELQRCLILVTL